MTCVSPWQAANSLSAWAKDSVRDRRLAESAALFRPTAIPCVRNAGCCGNSLGRAEIRCVSSSARRAPSPASKRVWADDLPAVALEEFLMFLGVGRAVLRERLDEAAGGGRGIEKEDAA